MSKLLNLFLPFLAIVSLHAIASIEESTLNNHSRVQDNVKTEVPIYYNFSTDKKEALDSNVSYEKGKTFLPDHPEVLNVYDALIADGITPFEAVTSTYVFMGSLLNE
ncbi:hypothetical protein AB6D11_03170 [Vibrio splendidus]